MSPAPERIPIRGPGTLIAVVPHLLGFHPEDSLVVLGIAGPHALVHVVFRYELPDPPDASRTRLIGDRAVSLLHREKLTAAVVVGYGAGRRVTPVTDVIRHVLPRDAIRLVDVLRVEDGRCWSYLCTEPSCCPPEGRPLNASDPAATALAGDGLTAVASRDDLAATIAAVAGAEAKAAERGWQQANRAIFTVRNEFGQNVLTARLRRAVQDAITRYREGGTIAEPAGLATLAIAVSVLEIRDDAWARMRPEHRAAHLRLWTDLTRHAMPGYVAAPASLLAFVAWQDGRGPLASLALGRALSDDPDYMMALLIGEALAGGLPPSLAVLSITPEEVADSYRALREDQ